MTPSLYRTLSGGAPGIRAEPWGTSLWSIINKDRGGGAGSGIRGPHLQVLQGDIVGVQRHAEPDHVAHCRARSPTPARVSVVVGRGTPGHPSHGEVGRRWQGTRLPRGSWQGNVPYAGGDLQFGSNAFRNHNTAAHFALPPLTGSTPATWKFGGSGLFWMSVSTETKRPITARRTEVWAAWMYVAARPLAHVQPAAPGAVVVCAPPPPPPFTSS